MSTNDFTDEDKDQIGTLGDRVEALENTKVDKISGKDLNSNDFTDEYEELVNQNAADIQALKDKKVDTEDGKSLSTNDFSDAYVAKIAHLLNIVDTFTKTNTIWCTTADSNEDDILDSDGNAIEGRIVYMQA